jgi:hypothetical protein
VTNVFKTISNVELRIQWSGAWDPFYNGVNDGFPGIEVPLELTSLAKGLKGMVISANTDDYNASVETAMRALLETVVGTEGPGNKRWVPMNDYWSTSSHIHWMGAAADSIVFQIGEQALTTGGKIDPTTPKVLYEDPYNFSAIRVGKATYWICISFQ